MGSLCAIFPHKHGRLPPLADFVQKLQGGLQTQFSLQILCFCLKNVLVFRGKFRKCQNQGIEHRRSQIEEMAIQQAHQQQGCNGKTDKQQIAATLLPEKVNRLHPMDAVTDKTYHTAACHQLDHRVMPTGGQE